MRVETQNILIQDEGDIVHVTLPPSKHSRTVVIAPDQVRVLENKPKCMPSLIYLSRRSTSDDANTPSINDVAAPIDNLPTKASDPEGLSVPPATIGTTRSDPAPSPGDTSTKAHMDPTVDVMAIGVGMDALDLEGRVVAHEEGRIDADEEFRVPEEVRNIYHPLSIGWKRLSWVVVFRGREIGVFHDFWARIGPLIKHEGDVITGASWKKAAGREDALRMWASAVKEGVVDRI